MRKKGVRQSGVSDETFWLRGKRPFFILALLCILIYFPAFSYGFSPLDERWLIVKQLGLLSHISNLPALFEHAVTGIYYRPVLMSSFMFDTLWGNGDAFAFHVTNILLHVLCTLLLYYFFLQLKYAKIIAVAASAVFAAHPMNVHSVAWIPGRNDTLLCLFTLLSCIMLLKYFSSKKIIYLFGNFIFFILALLTKENAIVLPVLYFLFWIFFNKESGKKIRLVISLVWVLFCIAWLFIRGNFVNHLPAFSSASFVQNIFYFLEGLITFGGKTFFPVQQSVMATLSDSSIIPSAIVLLIIGVIVFRFGFHDKKIAILGIVWFFSFLFLPVWFGATSSNHDLYEHRVYTSLIGAFLFITQLKIKINSVWNRRAVLLLIVIFSVKTFMRCAVYENPVSFLEAATEESPGFAIMHDMLGCQYMQTKEYKKARECFDEAIRLNPTRDQFYNHRGNLYYQTKNYELALEDFNKTLSLNDTQSLTLINRSMVNYYLGNHKNALDDIKRADKSGANTISPDYIKELFSSLQVDTIEMCNEKLRTDSLDAASYNQRGICYLRINKPKEAVSDFSKALRLKPSSEAFRSNRDFALQQLRK